MARLRPRGSGAFTGSLLIFMGLLLLLHNYRGFDLTDVVTRWWPLIFIFWGGVKLYERTAGAKEAQPGGSRITAGGAVVVVRGPGLGRCRVPGCPPAQPGPRLVR